MDTAFLRGPFKLRISKSKTPRSQTEEEIVRAARSTTFFQAVLSTFCVVNFTAARCYRLKKKGQEIKGIQSTGKSLNLNLTKDFK